jgi:hypothetical protein
MMQIEPSRLSYIESCKDTIFDEMVLQVARHNGVPLMAAGWDSVLSEIELEVESLLMRPFGMNGQPSPEIEGMILMWRKLDNEARSLRAANDWQAALPMAV